MSGDGRERDEAEAGAAAGDAAKADARGADDLVAVARIVKVRGLRGEVAADLLTDYPERFARVERLIAVAPGGGRMTLKVEQSRLHAGRVLLRFAGYETPEAARALVGMELTVPESEAVELGEGEFFDWQLQGCRVETVGGRALGRVARVLHYGAAPVLVVEEEGGGGDAKGREHLIPLAESICVEIDTRVKLIRVDPPEGLLEF